MLGRGCYVHGHLDHGLNITHYLLMHITKSLGECIDLILNKFKHFKFQLWSSRIT